MAMLTSRLALAQTGPGVAVFDLANFGQNTIQAVQLVLTVANQALELAKLGNIAIAADMGSDMAEIAAIVQDARGIMVDVASLQSIFDPSPYRLPTTLAGMRERIAVMNDTIKGAQGYAMKAQRLLVLLQSLTRHITSLVDNISAILGNKQGNQSLLQQEALMNKSLAIFTTQAASYQRLETLEHMRRAVIVNMNKEIQRRYWLPYFDIGTDYEPTP